VEIGSEPAQIQDIREGVRSWLSTAWDPGSTVRAWWAKLADSGWAYPHWPVEWFGMGLPPRATAAVYEELANADVLGPPTGGGPTMGASVLFAHGSDEQRRRWLPVIARGEEHWCQFFSEPDAGSDLASLQTSATRDGDQWIIDGQKVWNSGTLFAERGLLLARSDFDQPKHRGITFFVIDVDQPGVEIRPIRQMNGRSEFNETFFTGARVLDRDRVGDVGDGFRLAMTTLMSERTTFAGGGDSQLVSANAGGKAGDLDLTVREILARPRDELGDANAVPIGTAEAMTALARRHGLADDPAIRQGIAHIYMVSESMRFSALRARAAAEAGRQPGPESSIGYLAGVRLVRRCRDLSARIAGPAAMLMQPDAPDGDAVALTITTAPCHGIQGGSEQIQLNIIGERILGLPREPQVDRDIPFRQVAGRGAPR
jgi:alkylation response protein AidB-like acyl-CoA dehydrogenase